MAPTIPTPHAFKRASSGVRRAGTLRPPPTLRGVLAPGIAGARGVVRSSTLSLSKRSCLPNCRGLPLRRRAPLLAASHRPRPPSREYATTQPQNARAGEGPAPAPTIRSTVHSKASGSPSVSAEPVRIEQSPR